MNQLTIIIDDDEDTADVILNDTDKVGVIDMICEADSTIEGVLHYMVQHNVQPINVKVDYR